jgi:hypothetical protein
MADHVDNDSRSGHYLADHSEDGPEKLGTDLCIKLAGSQEARIGMHLPGQPLLLIRARIPTVFDQGIPSV